jgi:nicotinate-nucleotide adenylyltransferase
VEEGFSVSARIEDAARSDLGGRTRVTARRRVGILGGMFDPIHCGHLDAAAAAQQALQLDEMLVLPANIPPHRAQPVASSYHRFAMVALAIAGRPSWKVLDLELREAAPSYTSRTLGRLHTEGFHAGELFFITGADAFVEIGSWKDYPALLDLSHFAVVSRPGTPASSMPDRLPTLAWRMYRTAEVPATVRTTVIFLIDSATTDVSSTAIRRACAAGESIAGMVPHGVRQHIDQHGLYRSPACTDGPGRESARQPAGRLHGQD